MNISASKRDEIPYGTKVVIGGVEYEYIGPKLSGSHRITRHVPGGGWHDVTDDELIGLLVELFECKAQVEGRRSLRTWIDAFEGIRYGEGDLLVGTTEGGEHDPLNHPGDWRER